MTERMQPGTNGRASQSSSINRWSQGGLSVGHWVGISLLKGTVRRKDQQELKHKNEMVSEDSQT